MRPFFAADGDSFSLGDACQAYCFDMMFACLRQIELAVRCRDPTMLHRAEQQMSHRSYCQRGSLIVANKKRNMLPPLCLSSCVSVPSGRACSGGLIKLTLTLNSPGCVCSSKTEAKLNRTLKWLSEIEKSCLRSVRWGKGSK